MQVKELESEYLNPLPQFNLHKGHKMWYFLWFMWWVTKGVKTSKQTNSGPTLIGQCII